MKKQLEQGNPEFHDVVGHEIGFVEDESGLLIATTTKSDAEVANEIYKSILASPEAADVHSLSLSLGVHVEQVVRVLHNYSPDGKGGVEYREGLGGGWLPEATSFTEAAAV